MVKMVANPNLHAKSFLHCPRYSRISEQRHSFGVFRCNSREQVIYRDLEHGHTMDVSSVID